MTRWQCKQCPWKVGSNPRDIPNGYSEEAHKDLSATIARDDSLPPPSAPLRMMACHDTPKGHEKPCVGWLHNQLGAGNNLALRIAVMKGHVDGDVDVIGPQHETFEETLP